MLYPVLLSCAHKGHVVFSCNLFCLRSEMSLVMKSYNVVFRVMSTSVVEPGQSKVLPLCRFFFLSPRASGS
jgi:hypothetical protein